MIPEENSENIDLEERDGLKIYADKEMVNQYITESTAEFDRVDGDIDNLRDALVDGLAETETKLRILKDEMLDLIETKQNKDYSLTNLAVEVIEDGYISDTRCNSLIKLNNGTLVGGFEGDENYVAWYDAEEKTWIKSIINGDHPNFETWQFAEKDGVLVTVEYRGMWGIDPMRIYYSTDNAKSFTQVIVDDDFKLITKSVIVVNGIFVIPVFCGGGDIFSIDHHNVNYIYSLNGKDWRFPTPEKDKIPSWTGNAYIYPSIRATSATATNWRDDGFVTYPYENCKLFKYYKYNYEFDPTCTDSTDRKYSPFIRVTPADHGARVSPSSSFVEARYCDDNVLINGGNEGVFVSEDKGITWRTLYYKGAILKARALCKVENGYIFGSTAGELLFTSNLIDFIDISVDTIKGSNIHVLLVDGDELIVAGKKTSDGKSIRLCTFTYENMEPKILVANSINKFNDIPLDITSEEFANWNPTTDELKTLIVGLINLTKTN